MKRPAFLDHDPVALAFGTSGMRGLVRDITDLQAYVSVKGAITYLIESGDIKKGDSIIVGGDLRPSTERISRACMQAILDCGCNVENAGLLPTPALVLHGIETHRAGVMITGSHIPFDRNGIKVSKSVGEVLKPDEAPILAAIEKVRAVEYARTATDSPFDAHAMLKLTPPLPPVNDAAMKRYAARYLTAFSGALDGVRIAFYEHSAVGRELIPTILRSLGATVVCVGRSDVFVPIDTENVSAELLERLEKLVTQAEQGAEKNAPPFFAIVSTDGDSDRPLVAAVLSARDAHTGRRVRFLSGDLLGLIVAEKIAAQVIAVPISANDAIERRAHEREIELHKTRIGSPYVIAALNAAREKDAARETAGARRVVGWEANGGFLVGSALPNLPALATRDAVLPIVANLAAAREQKVALDALWAKLPARFGKSGLVDEVPVETSRAIIKQLIADASASEIRFDGAAPPSSAWQTVKQHVEAFFTPALGYDALVAINLIDGVRLSFKNGDVAHLRASGNAPQLRIYANANTQARADAIVHAALASPDGLLARMIRAAQTGGAAQTTHAV